MKPLPGSRASIAWLGILERTAIGGSIGPATEGLNEGTRRSHQRISFRFRQIAEVVSRIKEGGYDLFLVLEATIGVSKQGEKTSDKTSLVTTLSTNPEFKINDQDLKFLKQLRIKIEDEK